MNFPFMPYDGPGADDPEGLMRLPISKVNGAKDLRRHLHKLGVFEFRADQGWGIFIAQELAEKPGWRVLNSSGYELFHRYAHMTTESRLELLERCYRPSPASQDALSACEGLNLYEGLNRRWRTSDGQETPESLFLRSVFPHVALLAHLERRAGEAKAREKGSSDHDARIAKGLAEFDGSVVELSEKLAEAKAAAEHVLEVGFPLFDGVRMATGFPTVTFERSPLCPIPGAMADPAWPHAKSCALEFLRWQSAPHIASYRYKMAEPRVIPSRRGQPRGECWWRALWAIIAAKVFAAAVPGLPAVDASRMVCKYLIESTDMRPETLRDTMKKVQKDIVPALKRQAEGESAANDDLADAWALLALVRRFIP